MSKQTLRRSAINSSCQPAHLEQLVELLGRLRLRVYVLQQQRQVGPEVARGHAAQRLRRALRNQLCEGRWQGRRGVGFRLCNPAHSVHACTTAAGTAGSATSVTSSATDAHARHTGKLIPGFVGEFDANIHRCYGWVDFSLGEVNAGRTMVKGSDMHRRGEQQTRWAIKPAELREVAASGNNLARSVVDPDGE